MRDISRRLPRAVLSVQGSPLTNLAPGIDLSTATPAMHEVLGELMKRGITWDLAAFDSIVICGGGGPSTNPSRIPERDRFLRELVLRGGGPEPRLVDDCQTFHASGGAEVFGETPVGAASMGSGR